MQCLWVHRLGTRREIKRQKSKPRMKLVKIKVYSLYYAYTEERLLSMTILILAEEDDICLLLSRAVHPQTTNCYAIN